MQTINVSRNTRPMARGISTSIYKGRQKDLGIALQGATVSVQQSIVQVLPPSVHAHHTKK